MKTGVAYHFQGGEKPARQRVLKMAGKSPWWLVPFGLAVYHLLENSPQFTEKAKDDNFKMAAEVVMLNETVDVSDDNFPVTTMIEN